MARRHLAPLLVGLVGSVLMVASPFLTIVEYPSGNVTALDFYMVGPALLLLAAVALLTLVLRPALAWLPAAGWLPIYLGVACLENTALNFHPGWHYCPPWYWVASIGGASCVIFASVRERKLAARSARRARPQTDLSAFD